MANRLKTCSLLSLSTLGVIGFNSTFADSASAATLITLDTFGDFATINGAIFELVDPNVASGSGGITPFLGVQSNGSQEGYNTAGNTEPADNSNIPGNSEETLVLQDPAPLTTVGGDFTIIPTVNIGGVDYLSFILDVNENDNSIDLTSLQLFQASSNDLDEDNPDTPLGGDSGNFGGAATLAYDLDAVMDTTLRIASPNSGSGVWDLNVFIPTSLFTSSDPYVYFYSAFNGSFNGFDEWATVAGGAPTGVDIPTPALLPGLIGFGMSIVRKRKQQQVESLAAA